MADILLQHFVKQKFQHLMPWLSADPTGKEQQRKELEEFIQSQNKKYETRNSNLSS